MNAFALFLGASIGLLTWSFLTRFSYAVHDATNQTTLSAKLAIPGSGTLGKMLWWVTGASIVWLVVFVGICFHFAHSDSPRQFLVWFFAGIAATPAFIAFTTIRWLYRRKLASTNRAQI